MNILQPVRACGTVHAGVHIATRTDVLPWAVTLEDPTIPVNLTALGVAPQGITIKERVVGYDMATGKPQYLVDPITGTVVCDMYDLIGSSHYPNAWDFIMEYAVWGLHRFVPTNTMLEKLTPSSEYIGIHMKGSIENSFEAYPLRKVHEHFEKCYSLDDNQREIHTNPSEDWLSYNSDTCGSLLYNNLSWSKGELNKNTMEVVRELVSVTYTGWATPKDIELRWQPAQILRVPIGKMGYWSIVDDGDVSVREKSMTQLERLNEHIKTYRITELEVPDEASTV